MHGRQWLFGAVAAALVALATSCGTAEAALISYSDLWDISQGSVVDDTSGVLNYSSTYRSDIRDMFGGRFAPREPGVTLFKDYLVRYSQPVPQNYLHYVEWHTPASVTLRSFALHVANDDSMQRRAFDQFTLYYGDGSGQWTSIYDTGAGYSYVGPHEIAVDLSSPVVAQYFRAEFSQAPYISASAAGPRVWELDGFDTLLDGSSPGTSEIPEPATIGIWAALVVGGLGWRVSRRKRTA